MGPIESPLLYLEDGPPLSKWLVKGVTSAIYN